MEQNPDLDDLNVSERPKDDIKEGEVVNVVKGTRRAIFEPEDDSSELEYGSWDDELLQLEIEVEHEGDTFPVYDTIRFYQNPSDRTALGQYINKYGAPTPEQEIKVDFDDDGNAQVRGIRNNN